jgi:hypothetical protein
MWDCKPPVTVIALRPDLHIAIRRQFLCETRKELDGRGTEQEGLFGDLL